MNLFSSLIFGQVQTMHGQTESDAYEPTMQKHMWAEQGKW